MSGRTAILIVNGFDRLGRFGEFEEQDAHAYPWIDICLREVQRRSRGFGHEILVWDNTQFDDHRALIEAHGAHLYPTSVELEAARAAPAIEHDLPPFVYGHAHSLHQLLRRVDDDVEYIITLDTDAVPVSDGWIGRLHEQLETTSLTGVWRDEMAEVLRPFVHPSCLCIRRDRLLRIDRPFGHAGADEDVGQRITDVVMACGEAVHRLRRSNVRNAHFLMGGIYGDLVYHHGAGSRKSAFRMTKGQARDDAAYSALRALVFTDFDSLVAALRGDGELSGIDWERPQPEVNPEIRALLPQAVAPADERKVPETLEELAALESRYRRIGAIGEWRSLHVERSRWDHYLSALIRAHERAGAVATERVTERLMQAASLDSGALSGFFPPNPELISGVLGVAVTRPDDDEHLGESLKVLIECNRRALVLAREAALAGAPIDINLIAVLQDVITEAQSTFTVVVPGGDRVEVELPRHQYKPASNYVNLADGRIAPFCPAGRVADEMTRFAEQLASPVFAASHPLVQAAYVHYGITVIHPFADGNGRLARTLASLFLMRATGIPMVVFAEQWPQYRMAANDALVGNLQGSLDRFSAFALASLDLATGLLAANPRQLIASRTAPPAAAANVVEAAALALVHDALWIEVHDMLSTPAGGVQVGIVAISAPPSIRDHTHRAVVDPRDGRRGVRVAVRGGGDVDLLFVPVVSTTEGDVLPVGISEDNSGALFEASLADVEPFPLEATLIRLRAWLARVLGDALDGSGPGR